MLVRATTAFMWISAFMLLLTIGIAATPRSKDAHTCAPIKSNHKVRLPRCDSGVFVKGTHGENDGRGLCCYKERNPVFSRQGNLSSHASCRKVRSLKGFYVNGVQYIVIADRGDGIQGQSLVTVIQWDEDEKTFVTVQSLQIANVYSADVVTDRDQVLLLVGVFDYQRCEQCDDDNSLVFQWNPVVSRFNADPIQRLPSSNYVHWFRDRHLNKSTFFTVSGRCGCPTDLHYWNRTLGHLVKIPNPGWAKKLRDSSTSDILVDSVRSDRTQYVLAAQLDGDRDFHRIRVFKLTDGGVAWHTNLKTNVQDREGMSVIQYKDQVFMCTISKGPKQPARTRATVYRLDFREHEREADARIMTQINSLESNTTPFSSCKLFVDSKDAELYVAMGRWTEGLKLMKYSPVAGRFMDAGELVGDMGTKDLVTFHQGDDSFMITAAAGQCILYTYR